MRITAITSYKHGGVIDLLIRLNWTQKELSTRSGIAPSTLGYIINLKRKPTFDQCNAIQKAFADVGVIFDPLEEWPTTFKPHKNGYKTVQSIDIDFDNILECKEAYFIEDKSRDEAEFKCAIEGFISTLKEREQIVIQGLYYENKTLREIGRDIGKNAETVRQIHAKALRKLRHPERLKQIDDYITV